MINKIKYTDYRKAIKEMQNELREFEKNHLPEEYGRCIEVYVDEPYGGCIESSVNWSAIGAVPADIAVAYALVLTKAAELAQNFQYNGFKVDYSDED